MTDSVPMKDFKQDVLSMIRDMLQAGFYSQREIRENVERLLYEEYASPHLKSRIRSTVHDFINNHEKEQLTWPAKTDCDRLDTAFQLLCADGIASFQNIGDCQYCSSLKLLKEIDQKKSPQEIKGYIFYHWQDADHAMRTGDLYLAFRTLDICYFNSQQMGHLITAALMESGLQWIWPGEMAERICLKNFDWKRRGPGRAPNKICTPAMIVLRHRDTGQLIKRPIAEMVLSGAPMTGDVNSEFCHHAFHIPPKNTSSNLYWLERHINL